MESLKQKLNNTENRMFFKNLLFQFAWCLLMTQVFLVETTIPLGAVRVTGICLGLICLSVLVCLNYSLKQWLIVGALGIVGILTSYISENNFALWSCILLACAKDIRYELTLRYMLIAMTVIFILAFALSSCGVIENIALIGTHGMRNKFSMGFLSANTAHAYFLTMCLLTVVLFYEKIGLVIAAAAIALNLLYFHLTKCKTSVALIVLLFAAVLITKKLRGSSWGRKLMQVLMLIGNVGIVLSMLILVGLPYFYRSDAPWISYFEHYGTVLARISLSHYFLENYHITFFGNYIHELVDHSYYLDIGYEVLLLRYGILFTMLFCVGSIYLLRYFRKKEGYAQYLAVMLILIHTCMENWYLIAFYNFSYFWMAEYFIWRNPAEEKADYDCRKKLFLRLNIEKANNAGFKAVRDCEKILQEIGFGAYDLYTRVFSLKSLNLAINGMIYLKLLLLPKNCDLVIAHPLYEIGFDYVGLLQRAKKEKNLRLIFLVHDLPSLRVDHAKTFKMTDGEMCAAADIIIVHNERMKKYIAETFGAAENKLKVLGLFDYLCDFREMPKRGKGKDIIIAGNLNRAKAGYLEKLSEQKDLAFRLYGGKDQNPEGDNVHYHGSFSPEELPGRLEGNFGLVWDGDSEKTCSGNFGEYLRINNPHKTSLYLAAGIPVIAWREAAIAEIISDQKLGITVSELGEISGKIDAISEAEYAQMQANVKVVGNALRTGAHLRSVFEDMYRG